MENKQSSLEIRLTEPGDREHLIAWFGEPQVLDAYPLVTTLEIEDAVDVWMEYSAKQYSITALWEGHLCGAANLYVNELIKLRHQALFVILVSQGYRGRGIGKALIMRLEKMAVKIGIELLHLEVYEGNRALKLYERLGFIYYGRHPRFLKHVDGHYCDKLLMQKWLITPPKRGDEDGRA